MPENTTIVAPAPDVVRTRPAAGLLALRRLVTGLASGLALGLAAGVVGGLAGCESSPAAGGVLTVDGDTKEWSPTTAVWADADFVYFRFSVEDEPVAIQHSPKMIAIAFDTDADATTGRALRLSATERLGVDVEVQFSPREGVRTPGQGAAVFRVGGDGSRTLVRNTEAGLVFSPTYASTWYEGRMSRAALSRPEGGAISGVFLLHDEDGAIEGYSDLFGATMPASRGVRAGADLDVPAKPDGAFRVVSYNVLRSKPVSEPDSFARVFQALAPDAVLVQEWDRGDAAELAMWFNAHAPGATPWRAIKAEDGGVAVVARAAITAVEPTSLEAFGPSGPRPVRFIAGALTGPGLPASGLILGSLHYKCCGGAGGPEEATRIEEARAVNGMLSQAIAAGGPAGIPLVVGGDFNLVGTSAPLDLTAQNLDLDGTRLDHAEPAVLGDTLKATWIEWPNQFTPARLDWVLYSDSAMRVAQTFVLDTTRISERSLARSGLAAADTDASDHKPVVVDLVIER